MCLREVNQEVNNSNPRCPLVAHAGGVASFRLPRVENKSGEWEPTDKNDVWKLLKAVCLTLTLRRRLVRPVTRVERQQQPSENGPFNEVTFDEFVVYWFPPPTASPDRQSDLKVTTESTVTPWDNPDPEPGPWPSNGSAEVRKYHLQALKHPMISCLRDRRLRQTPAAIAGVLVWTPWNAVRPIRTWVFVHSPEDDSSDSRDIFHLKTDFYSHNSNWKKPTICQNWKCLNSEKKLNSRFKATTCDVVGCLDTNGNTEHLYVWRSAASQYRKWLGDHMVQFFFCR